VESAVCAGAATGIKTKTAAHSSLFIVSALHLWNLKNVARR
jgi:hypothetical protein